MAISWGGFHNHLRVGIEIWTVPGSFNNGTTSAETHVRYWVGTDGWAFNDSQVLNLQNAWGGEQHAYTKSGAGDQAIVEKITVNGTSYGGGPSWNFGAQVSGAYNGASPSHNVPFTLPARPAGVPDAPGYQSNSALSSSQVYLDWYDAGNNGAAVDTYEIWLNSSPSIPGTVQQPGNDTDISFSGLNRATRYYWGVRAHNAAGWGPWSNTGAGWWVDTMPTVPDAPGSGSISHSNLTANSVTINITPPNNGGAGIDDYDVQLYADPGFTQHVWNDPNVTTATSYNVSGLQRATTYYIRFRAHNSQGWGNFSGTGQITTLATVPDAPTGLAVGSITSSGGSLSWTAPASGGAAITEYDVHVSTVNTFASLTIDDVDTASPYAMAGLSRITTYYARVRAKNSGGAGAWSSTISFQTLATVPDAGPAPSLNITAPDTVVVTFSAPNNGGSTITGYTVQWSTDNFATQAGVATTSSSPYTVIDLVPGTTYQFRYRANNAIGNGAYSPSASGETLSGGEIKVAGTWRNARAYGKVTGTWRNLKVHKKVSGTWRL